MYKLLFLDFFIVTFDRKIMMIFVRIFVMILG